MCQLIAETSLNSTVGWGELNTFQSLAGWEFVYMPACSEAKLAIGSFHKHIH